MPGISPTDQSLTALCPRWGIDWLQQMDCKACYSFYSTKLLAFTIPVSPAPFSHCSQPCSAAHPRYRCVVWTAFVRNFGMVDGCG